MIKLCEKTPTLMPAIKRIVLDVLKPHQPNALEFARSLASISTNCRVKLKVLEVDDKTQTIQVELESENLEFERIEARISEMGASIHSIDEVEVSGSTASE